MLNLTRLLAVALATSAATGQVLLRDDFNDNQLDPSKWKVVTSGVPCCGAAVSERNQRAEIVNRGHLVTVRQFDPSKLGGIRIRGKWTIAAAPCHDIFQILTRSDGIPTGRYGDTRHGLEFLGSTEQNTFRIHSRSSLILVGALRQRGVVSFQATKTYEFEVIDAGAFARISVREPQSGTAWSLEAKILADSTTSRHVVFHNREHVCGNNVVYLDDVAIEKLPPLTSDRLSLSARAGGEVNFTLVARGHPGSLYLLLGSMTGTARGIQLGRHRLPLDLDGYFQLLASNPNVVIAGSFSLLDLCGVGRAQLFAPPGYLRDLVGRKLHHAFVAMTPRPFSFDFTSNAVALSIVR